MSFPKLQERIKKLIFIITTDDLLLVSLYIQFSKSIFIKKKLFDIEQSIFLSPTQWYMQRCCPQSFRHTNGFCFQPLTSVLWRSSSPPAPFKGFSGGPLMGSNDLLTPTTSPSHDGYPSLHYGSEQLWIGTFKYWATCSLIPHCSLCSGIPRRSFVRLLTHP